MIESAKRLVKEETKHAKRREIARQWEQIARMMYVIPRDSLPDVPRRKWWRR